MDNIDDLKRLREEESIEQSLYSILSSAIPDFKLNVRIAMPIEDIDINIMIDNGNTQSD